MAAKQLLEFKNLDLKSIRRPDGTVLAERLSPEDPAVQYFHYLSSHPAVTDLEEREAMGQLSSGQEAVKDTIIIYYLPLVAEIAMAYTLETPFLLDLLVEGNLALKEIVETGKSLAREEVLRRIHHNIFHAVLKTHTEGLAMAYPLAEYLEDLSFKMGEREIEILKRLCRAEDLEEELLLCALDYQVSIRRIAQVWNRGQRIIRRAMGPNRGKLKEFLENP